jgi:hypothetical protein
MLTQLSDILFIVILLRFSRKTYFVQCKVLNIPLQHFLTKKVKAVICLCSLHGVHNVIA